jgi:ACR3 family arsenite efflux pump ArsB
MKLYLAAAFSRRKEILKVASKLHGLGYTITSRWLAEAPNMNLVQVAIRDLSDVRASDILIRFTDDLSMELVQSHLCTGSRMFEAGVAYEHGIQVVVVGGYQPIFDHLPDINHVRDVKELIKWLKEYKHANFRKRCHKKS